MEDQFEESDALGMGIDNCYEYDIAEEEEERLLEEDEITDRQLPFPYENNETEPNFSDADFETPDTEEDVLEIGLNEDIIEYEEQNTDSQETLKSNQSSSQIQVSESSSSGLSCAVQNSSNSSTKLDVKRININRGPQQGGSRKHFVNHRQSNFPIPVQIRGPPYRMAHPGVHQNQRLPFEGSARPFMGRNPSILDYQAAPGFSRCSIPSGNEQHFFAHNYNHALSLQRIQRHPFKDHPLAPPPHPFMESDRNGANRFFINPHYKGSVVVNQNICSNSFSDRGSGFSSSVKPPPVRMTFQGRPPHSTLAGPSLMIAPRGPLSAPMRFPSPNPTNYPPPRLNGPSDSTLSPQRFKSNTPQNLMDMILPIPFEDGLLRAPQFSEPPRARFRFVGMPSGSNDFSSNFRGLPPTMPTKRPAPFDGPMPLKQLRLGSTGIIQVHHTFPPPSSSTVVSSAPRSSIDVQTSAKLCPQQTTQTTRVAVQPSKLPPVPVFSSPDKPMSSLPPTSSILGSPPSSAVNVKSNSPPVSAAQVPESPEMKEYLQKMEEQRKKREEVLRLKEERRRLKLTTSTDKNESVSSVADDHPNQSPVLPSAGGNQSNSAGQTTQSLLIKSPNTTGNLLSKNIVEPAKGTVNILNSSTTTNGENGVSPSGRKTLLVKPTPTTSVLAPPQVGPGVHRRYKIIIVKNKAGKILEKRRVPIDDFNATTLNSGGPTALPQSQDKQAMNRVSETVAIENLNLTSTEEDVRNLCQMFGSVQEIWPKLQEGKAIVRFASANGASNFLNNHNTPGICVRYL